jgi:hypothetical protein
MMSVMQTDEEVNESEILVHEVEEETDEYEIDSQEGEEPIKMMETLTAISTLRKYITQSDGMVSCHGLLDKISGQTKSNRTENTNLFFKYFLNDTSFQNFFLIIIQCIFPLKE